MPAKRSAKNDETSVPKKAHPSDAQPVVLAIDIGGSHVKIQTSAGGEERRVDSGPAMTALDMVKAVTELSKDLAYDVVSIGYPGPVAGNKPVKEPVHLGAGWASHDFSASFGKPAKVVNDALMQAIGSYEGGRMLFLGLGTGLGAAMVVENVAHGMEIGHLPYKNGKSFEEYVCELSLEQRGKKKWRKIVFNVVETLQATMLPDYVVIGGGNVEKLPVLPPNCVRGDNAKAFFGGFRLWHDKRLVI